MKKRRCSHVTVCQAPELLHAKRLLLDVVLSEEPGLASYHLLDGSVDHQIVYVIVGTTRLPAFWWNHLKREEKRKKHKRIRKSFH